MLKRWMNKDDETPLHDAIKNGRVEVVELLVQHGADANLVGPKWENGFTPLH